VSYYPNLKAQLDTDIRAAWNFAGTDKVYFGQPLTPPSSTLSATVRAKVTRENAPRHVNETWEIEIEGRFPKPVGADLDEFLMARGFELVMLLAPYDLTTPPASPQPYASVGGRPRVTLVQPLDSEQGDSTVGVLLNFTCETVVYQ
jgi:hypothetical protein